MMKKEYRRPTIVIEQFTLAAHIASCGVGANSSPLGTPTMKSQGECGFKLPNNRVVFTDSANDCTFKIKGDQFRGYCYNVPTASMSLFSS